MSLIHVLPLWILLSSIYGLPNRNERTVGLFNYVTFPNDICTGTSDIYIGGRGGVCWTKEECAALKGIADGGCASGYGVCCIFLPSCGATVTQNLTHLVQDITSNPTTKVCAYTLCPVSESVNRIRLDFITFVIAGPAEAAEDSTTSGSAVGDCVTDSFSVTSGGGGRSSPIICGINTAQHVIVDTDGENCVTASFVYGGDSVERQYDIRVLQYERNNEMGGPPGCLQFRLGSVDAPYSGTITSFNFEGGTHLSSQNYEICIRRAAGQCFICWFDSKLDEAGTQGAFGLSLSGSTSSDTSVVGVICMEDYVVIPDGVAKSTLQDPIVTGNGGRFCGRGLEAPGDTATGQANDPKFVCSRLTPFRLRFVTDADDDTSGSGANMNTKTNEASRATNDGAFGTMGISLGFVQVSCAEN